MRIHLSTSICCGLLVSGFAACQVDEDTGNDDSGVDSHSQQQEEHALRVHAAVSEKIQLVVRVDWETDAISTGYLEFGETEALGTVVWSSAEGDTTHSELMLGLLADTEYHYRVVSIIDGEEVVSDLSTITTGSLPPELPEFTQEGDASLIDEWIIVPLMGSVYAVTIVDGHGQYRWYYIPEDQHFKTIRARISQDGQSILYNSIVADEHGHRSPGNIMRISMDGMELESLNTDLIPNMHHDFCQWDDGRVAAMSFETKKRDDMSFLSDRIIEIQEDGSYIVAFDTLSHFDPEVDRNEHTDGWWTHGNALVCDIENGQYFYGIRNFSSIHKIDRSSGQVFWGLGTIGNDFSYTDNTTLFTHQHNFHVLEDSILIFSNERTGTNSRVVEYELNEESLIANQIWTYEREPALDVTVLGDVARTGSGDTHINWSMRGVMERVSMEGSSLWELQVGLGSAFGYSTLIQSMYSE